MQILQIIFSKYITQIITHIENKAEQKEYNEFKTLENILLYNYIDKIQNRNILRILTYIFIDNILNNKNQIICFHIIEENGIINYIYALSDEIGSTIIKKVNEINHYFRIKKDTREITIEERKEKISSIFKEHETKLREFIEQLKND